MDNATKNSGAQNKPNTKMIGIILAVIIVLVLVIVLLSSKKGEEKNPEGTNNTVTEQTAGDITGGEVAPTGEGEMIETITTETGQVIPAGAEVEVAGANPIIDNIVVTPTGQVANNASIPMSPDAPQQTPPITKDELPASVIKLDVTSSGFTPSSFEVKKGEPVTFSLTSADSSTHVFMFDSPELAAVAIGVGPGETRAITFNAPSTAGEYSFRCDVPGHSSRGETGKMIVK